MMVGICDTVGMLHIYDRAVPTLLAEFGEYQALCLLHRPPQLRHSQNMLLCTSLKTVSAVCKQSLCFLPACENHVADSYIMSPHLPSLLAPM